MVLNVNYRNVLKSWSTRKIAMVASLAVLISMLVGFLIGMAAFKTTTTTTAAGDTQAGNPSTSALTTQPINNEDAKLIEYYKKLITGDSTQTSKWVLEKIAADFDVKNVDRHLKYSTIFTL